MEKMKNYAKKLAKEAIRRYKRRRVSEINIRNVISNFGGDNTFVFPSPSVPWGYLFQRPQQMAYALSKLNNNVIYSVEGEYRIEPDKNVIGLKEIADNLFLYNDYQNGRLLESLDKAILWRYWSNQINYFESKNNRHIYIYDWVDDIEVYNYSDKEIQYHNKLIEDSDILITTAENIYIKACKIRDDVLLLPNACDYNFFANPIDIDWKELDYIRECYDVIIGYYGAIAEWFDFEILKYCAQKNPDWLFLLVGQAYPGVLKDSNVSEYDNILIWDRVEYSKLPYLLSKFDVSIIPFKINSITQSTSPVKIYEYMAGGKPVVSTALKEVEKLGIALIATDRFEFNEQLRNAVDLSKNKDYIANLRNVAKENSWENRAKQVLNILLSRGLIG